MKVLCTGLFILSFSFLSFGQDYKLFNSASRKSYTNFPVPDSTLSIAFDSVVKVGADSVYYNFATTGNTIITAENCNFWGTPECTKQDRPSWLGSKVIYNNATGYKFLTINGDTLNFDFSVTPGDSSLFFENQQEKFYLNYLKSDSISVLGYPDSARFYTIIHTDVSGNTINSTLNGQKIIVAKDLGLVQFMQVDAFPAILNPVYLIGTINPDLGLAKLTNEMVYNYTIGDEFQIEDKLTYNYPSPDNHEQYIKYSILAKSLTVDSIIYQVQKHLFDKGSSTATDEIIDLKYLRNNVVTEIPYEYYKPFESGFFVTRKLYLEDYCGMKLWTYHIMQNRGSRYCEASNCWGNNDVPGPPPLEDTVYAIGLGIFSSIYSDAFLAPPPSTDYSFSRKIIYFKKNDIICGSEAIMGINELPVPENFFSLYPVPAKDLLTIETPFFEGSYITISSASGQAIVKQQLAQSKTEVNIGNLAKGIYLVKLSSVRSVIVRKFVKE